MSCFDETKIIGYLDNDFGGSYTNTQDYAAQMDDGDDAIMCSGG